MLERIVSKTLVRLAAIVPSETKPHQIPGISPEESSSFRAFLKDRFPEGKIDNPNHETKDAFPKVSVLYAMSKHPQIHDRIMKEYQTWVTKEKHTGELPGHKPQKKFPAPISVEEQENYDPGKYWSEYVRKHYPTIQERSKLFRGMTDQPKVLQQVQRKYTDYAHERENKPKVDWSKFKDDWETPYKRPEYSPTGPSGKNAALRLDLIKLAHFHPEIRKHLIPLLREK